MQDYVIVAFGGNAIFPSGQRGTQAEQRANARRMSAQLGRLVLDGHRVVVTHGNGPQVGEIMLKSDLSSEIVPPITLDVAGAMSQGQIGYLLQQEIGNFLLANGSRQKVCSIVSQVVVDPDDPAFQRPTKPIGRFYGEVEAASLHSQRGWTMVEDAGRGYRRVVPSPMPKDIVEWPSIKVLADAGVLIIAAGGGGVPVVRENDTLQGVEAVIDKDLTACRLGSLIGAKTLVLLTEVEAVAVNFGTPEQRPLGLVSLTEMRDYYRAGHFPPGSMGPKVRSALEFLDAGGERVIITTPDRLVSAVEDRIGGTQITASSDVGAPAPSPVGHPL
jgi:carbamate kinase